MRNKVFFIFLFFLLIAIINIVSFLKYNYINKIKDERIELLEKEIFKYVDSNVHFVTDSIRTSIFKDNSEYQQYELIYRFFGDECVKCVLADIELLKGWSRLIGKNNVTIITDEPNEKNKKILLRNIMRDEEYCLVEKKVFNVSDDLSYHRRYFAVIDTEGFIRKIFYPDVKDSTLYSKYFENIYPFFDN